MASLAIDIHFHFAQHKKRCLLLGADSIRARPAVTIVCIESLFKHTTSACVCVRCPMQTVRHGCRCQPCRSLCVYCASFFGNTPWQVVQCRRDSQHNLAPSHVYVAKSHTHTLTLLQPRTTRQRHTLATLTSRGQRAN